MVTDGSSFRVVAGDQRPPFEVAAVAFSKEEPSALETVQGCDRESTGLQNQVEPRCSPRDRPILSNQARESFGDDGGRARPAVEVLKAELTKARAAQKQPAVEVEVDQCRKFIARSERRIRELDTQRAEEGALKTEAQERLERLLEAQSRAPTTMPFQDPAPQVTSLQQMVNTVQAERDALAQEFHRARQQSRGR